MDPQGTVLKTERVPIGNAADVVAVRRRVRAWAMEIKFSLVDQTKIVTAASELARNALEHGKGGELEIAWLVNGVRSGIRMRFSDQGPGIADIKLALTDGFTTGNGMGLGLSGSKRLMSDFDVESKPGAGTTVTATRWK